MHFHDRKENSCTVSISHCPIQSLRKLKALYGTAEGTYSAQVLPLNALILISSHHAIGHPSVQI